MMSDPNSPEQQEALSKIKKLVAKHNLGYLFNPGGAEFLNDSHTFRCQIFAYDNVEDYTELLTGLRKAGMEEETQP